MSTTIEVVCNCLPSMRECGSHDVMVSRGLFTSESRACSVAVGVTRLDRNDTVMSPSIVWIVADDERAPLGVMAR